MKPKTIYFFLYFVILFGLLATEIQSQSTNYSYPTFFAHFNECNAMFNPSSIGRTRNMEVFAGNQYTLGYDSKFSSGYGIFNKQLSFSNNPKHPYSAIGLYVFNEREGKYIHRSRMYIQYAWHAKLNRKYFFSGGVKAGAFNYAVKVPGYYYGNTSVFSPDAGAGISIYSDINYFGICFDQLFRSQLQPYEEVTELPPFITFNTYKKIPINESFVLTPSFILRKTTMKANDINCIMMTLGYLERIEVAFGIIPKFGINSQVSIHNIELGENTLNASFSYTSPTQVSLQNISVIEANLGYLLKKSNK